MKESFGSSRGRMKNRRSTPSLRPPTLMIDLLFGALMLFAFQMGDPNSQNVISHDIELPADETADAKNAKKILPLLPVDVSGEWFYKTNDGRRLTPDEVAGKAKSSNMAPVLVLSKQISVQKYVDAETPLRMLGLKVGLAVTPDKEKNK